MTIDVDIDTRRRHVELEHAGDGWKAVIDGRILAVDAVRTPFGWSLLVDQQSYDVSINDQGRGSLAISVGGHTIQACVVDSRRYRPRGASSADNAAGSGMVVAPMPGRVVKVLVRAGDRVAARQGLVVVEAMKMENELRAPRDARVAEVRAVEGVSVEAGSPLVILE